MLLMFYPFALPRGSAKGYGNETSISIVFEATMAVALCCNIILAILGSILWINAILFSGSMHDFVYEARKVLDLLQYLMIGTIMLVTV